MTAAEIRASVIEILKTISPDTDFSELDDERPFREQVELDSMDFLDIVLQLRKLYRIHIPEEDYPALQSLASTVAYLEPKMRDLQKV